MAATFRTFLNGMAQGLHQIIPLYLKMKEYEQQEEMIGLQKKETELRTRQVDMQAEEQKYRIPIMVEQAKQLENVNKVSEWFEPKMRELELLQKELEVNATPENIKLTQKQLKTIIAEGEEKIKGMKLDRLTGGLQQEAIKMKIGWDMLKIASLAGDNPETFKQLMDVVQADSPREMQQMISNMKTIPTDVRIQALGLLDYILPIEESSTKMSTNLWLNSLKEADGDEKKAKKIFDSAKYLIEDYRRNAFGIMGFRNPIDMQVGTGDETSPNFMGAPRPQPTYSNPYGSQLKNIGEYIGEEVKPYNMGAVGSFSPVIQRR